MKFKKFFNILGPGLLYAGAAVGVSHLVQSTRAGASYGFYLVWILIIANIIKYPFFEFAPRYASATSKSLISGYEKLGKWAIILFSILTITTMFAIQAAVTLVTAGLVAYVFDFSVNIIIICGFILGITMVVLIFGKYSILDTIIKFVIVTLALSTIVAVCFSFGINLEIKPDFITQFSWQRSIDIAFLFAFVGWMPAPLDVSVWHSLWTVAKKKETKVKVSLKESLLDFRIGYIGTAFLALGFLTLGALVMFGSGEQLSSVGCIFAEQ
jgi:Mn2+/Fe2+ NRAMP family transporter